MKRWWWLVVVFWLLGTEVALGVAPLKFVVGKPVKIYGPGWFADAQLETFKNNEVVYGYNGVQETHLFEGSNPETLRDTGNKVIGRGNWGKFDGDGSWLTKVWVDNGVVKGLYHAENCHEAVDKREAGVCPEGLHKIKSVAYAESADGGVTFNKTDYPNNQVIIPNEISEDGSGDFSMVRIGSYYYLYYFRGWREDKWIGVARSAVSSGGKPGTWFKYYNGAFSEPGLGGRSNGILTGTATHVIYNSFLNRYLLVTMADQDSFVLYISNWENDNDSDAGIDWVKYPYPLVPAGESGWEAVENKFQGVLAYPSIMGLDGGSEVAGKEFYISYTWMPPGKRAEKMNTIVVRKVRVDLADNNEAMVSIQSYKNSESGNTIYTNNMVEEEGYEFEKVLGYVRTTKIDSDDSRPIRICYDGVRKDHLIRAGEDECKSYEEYQGTVGSVLKNSGLEREPLYRCFDRSKNKHNLSITLAGCEGGEQLGFIYTMETKGGFNFERVCPAGTVKAGTDKCYSGDVDCNGVVNISDFGMWMSEYLDYEKDLFRPLWKADINCDSKINISDFGIWRNKWVE